MAGTQQEVGVTSVTEDMLQELGGLSGSLRAIATLRRMWQWEAAGGRWLWLAFLLKWADPDKHSSVFKQDKIGFDFLFHL